MAFLEFLSYILYFFSFWNVVHSEPGFDNFSITALHTDFILEIMKRRVIASSNLLAIFSGHETGTSQTKEAITLSLYKRIAKNCPSYIYTSTSRRSEDDKIVEILWCPFVADQECIMRLEHLIASGDMTEKYILVHLNDSNESDMLPKLLMNPNYEVFYYQYLESAKNDSSSYFILKEAYKVNNETDEVKVITLASFSNVVGFNILNYKSKRGLRVHNLKGKVFRGLFEKQRLSVQKIISNTTKDNMTTSYKLLGITIDIMKVLAKRLNFSVVYEITRKRHNWTYIADAVGKGEYDFTVNFFQHTYHRSKSADLSFGFLDTALRLYYPKSVEGFKWMAYFHSFKCDTWLFVILHFIGTGSVMYFMTFCLGTTLEAPRHIKNKRNRYHKYKQTHSIISPLKIFAKSINFSLRSLIAKRHRKEPNTCAVRIAFLSSAFAGFIIITVYRSMLAASIAIVVDHPPIQSLKEVLTFSRKLIIWKDTEIERLFELAKEGTIEYKIKQAGLLIPVRLNDSTYLTKFVHGLVPNTVLLTWKTHGELMNPNNDPEKPYPCKIKSIGKDYVPLSSGLLYSKGWRYTKLFNHHMLKLQERGILDLIYNKYKRKKKSTCSNKNENISHSNIFETISAFTFLGAFYAISFIVFLVESLGKRIK